MELPNWKEEDGFLVKEFELSDFLGVVDFVNEIAGLAEKAGHHPDLEIYGYNKLKVKLKTHSKGKVTDKDYDLAGKIERL